MKSDEEKIQEILAMIHGINDRINKIDKRLDAVEERLGSVEKNLGSIGGDMEPLVRHFRD